MFAFLTEAGLRRKYRRWVLAALGAFIVVSAAMHFTLGSILLALLPSQAPAADAAITIVTLSRAPEQQPSILTITRSDVALRDLTNPTPRRSAATQPSAAAPAAQPAFESALSPATAIASASGAGRKARTHRRAAVAELRAPGPQLQSPAGGDGENAGTWGAGQGYVGRQITSGAVWAQGGPAGQDEGTGGGIELGGDPGTMRFPPPVHDSCSPPRGQFF